MKTVRFEKLSIKNFLSIGNETVEIYFNNGINLITGENLDSPGSSNAIGKSSIIDAFYFVIFGSSLRNLNKDQIVNKYTGNQAEVILDFIVESPIGKNKFSIKRTVGPTSLKVVKDNIDKTRDSIANTTKYILEVLSATPEVFKNCIIMRANNTIPFMHQSTASKKKFIEDLFNLDIISKMFKAVKDDFNSNKRDVDIENKLYSSLEDNLEKYKDKLKNQYESGNSLKASYENKLKVLQEEIKEYDKKLEEFNLKLKEDNEKSEKASIEFEEVKNKIFKIEKLKDDALKHIHESNSLINLLKEQLKEYENKGDICPVCHRKYDEESLKESKIKQDELKEKIKSSLENKIKYVKVKQKIDSTFNTLQEKFKKLSEDKNMIFYTKDSIKSLEREKKFSEASYKKLKEKYESLNEVDDSGIKVLKDFISTTEKEIKQKSKVISKLNENLNRLEISKFILSEEGIRSYIISKLLELLNFRISYYLSKMGSKYQLSFNDMFEETIIGSNNILMNYGNLSGAESKMLDLACIWSFRDILRLQGSVEYNVAFYDEILDSSMDAKNSEIICNILNEFGLKENQSIFVISHKSDLVKSLNFNMIKLKKEKNITVLA